MSVHIEVFPDPAALAEGVARWLAGTWSGGERYSLALSGGHTPETLYRLLARDPWRRRVPWERLDLFLGDERDLPPEVEGSNFRMIQQSLLAGLGDLPGGGPHLHRWRTEATPAQALEDYRRALAPWARTGPWPVLDTILLGVGPEGHVASIFPDSPALDTEEWVMHLPVPAQPPVRYTLTLPVLNAARRVAFLVTGATKAPIVAEVLQGDAPPRQVPARGVRAGEVIWFLDREAARLLTP
ncbi:Putative 6-phosphogluconolactonase [Candidatus Hydrogenisulfobacillus filiaventi]|uniref:6-phosphogluconolactonase n=1 Tax=Candidatus Hydrogenisulfobacillus filiaventi TaxID=2707344 RepID=A0A6F8ZGN6_9FIRM|nr:6-phosphogluconolactonase [Bacillota bacterium]CAB1128625.1 Putative 6-phosphogluconolactonase [Candidatus Hydrogenisulfobacillus filiaventi]